MLNEIAASHLEVFYLKLYAPVLISDLCLLLLKPKIYYWATFYSVRQSDQVRIRLRTFVRENILLHG